MNGKETALKIKEIRDKGNAIIEQRKGKLKEWRIDFEREEGDILSKYSGDELKEKMEGNIRSYLWDFLNFMDGYIYYDYNMIYEHFTFFFNNENAKKYGNEFITRRLREFLFEVERVKKGKEKKIGEWEDAKSKILKNASEGEEFFLSEYYLSLYKDNVKSIDFLQWQTDPQNKLSARRKKEDQPKYNLSCFEWATIFYYAESANLIPGKKKSDKATEFFKTHSLTFSEKSFLNNTSKANKRINTNNDYPLKKLNRILPIVTEYYPLLVGNITNDIEILRDEQANSE